MSGSDTDPGHDSGAGSGATRNPFARPRIVVAPAATAAELDAIERAFGSRLRDATARQRSTATPWQRAALDAGTRGPAHPSAPTPATIGAPVRRPAGGTR